MAKKNSDYWQNRFEQLEKASHQEALNTYSQIEESFEQAQREIERNINNWYVRFANNNQITITDAKKMLNASELKELKWDIQEYIKYGKENELNELWIKELENASAKYHVSRLEALKIQTQQTMEKLFGNELDEVDKMTSKTYTNNYYHTMFEVQKGFNVGFNIGKIDDNKLSKIVSKPWAVDEKNFSERIWGNKTKLINELHNQLTIMCVQGKSPDNVIKYMSKKFNTSKAQAGNLVMTESAYFSQLAQKDCFKDLDVEEYEIVATLDSHTSEICQEQDGKVYKMSDYQPGVTAPPFHNYCRSTTVPHFNDDYDIKDTRAARDEDGNTYYVENDIKYKDWYQNNVKSDDNLKNVSKSDKIKEKVPNNSVDFYKYLLNNKNKEDFTTTKSDENGYITGQRLNSMLGYDNLPKKVSIEEFEKLSKESEFGTLYRGVTAETAEKCQSYIDDFKNGRFYSGGQAGHIYGKGTYTGFGELGKQTARNYANGSEYGQVLEMVLDKNAKTITYYDLFKEVNNEVDEFIKNNYKKYNIDNYMKLITNLNKIEKEDEFMTQYVLNVMHDVGYNASIKGYDAIIADNEFAKQKYVVVLNRSKVIVHE